MLIKKKSKDNLFVISLHLLIGGGDVNLPAI